MGILWALATAKIVPRSPAIAYTVTSRARRGDENVTLATFSCSDCSTLDIVRHPIVRVEPKLIGILRSGNCVICLVRRFTKQKSCHVIRLDIGQIVARAQFY